MLKQLILFLKMEEKTRIVMVLQKNLQKNT